eukprot:TRINITY_DN2476_c0_g1_i6.p1 TRINITY_DN2476_c0_g1~~TRINITY_DN2476_c0_g1_i6.p1  ORF type:complete len:257 (-),score=55.76 TRINITY_DN2476_c0_g1_i6:147-917(-)
MAACGCGPKKEEKKNKILEPKEINYLMELVINEKYYEAWTTVAKNEENLNHPLDNSGMTILMLAVVQQAHPLLDLILENARDKATICTQKNIHGDTALHLAALTGSRVSVVKLLKYGFTKEVQNNLGETPLKIAEDEGHVEAIIALGGNPPEKQSTSRIVSVASPPTAPPNTAANGFADTVEKKNEVTAEDKDGDSRDKMGKLSLVPALADSMEIDLNDGFESDEEQARSRIVTTRFRVHATPSQITNSTRRLVPA